jgi:hypothetical protein
MQQSNPSPNFYKIMALVFLAVGAVLLWQAVIHGGWFFWTLGIMTIVNAGMSGLKSLVPRETRK